MAMEVLYEFWEVGRRRWLVCTEPGDALYAAVLHLLERRATPIEIRTRERRLWDAAAIAEIAEACRAEWAADHWRVPAGIAAAAALVDAHE